MSESGQANSSGFGDLQAQLRAALRRQPVDPVRARTPRPTPAVAVESASAPNISAAALAVADRILVAAGLAAASVATAGGPRSGSVIRTVAGTLVAIAEGEQFIVGRVPGEGRLAVVHPELSRTHLALMQRDGALTATDLRSTNGTGVRRGGRLCHLEAERPFELLAGDRLVVLGDILIGDVLDVGGKP